MQENLEKKAKLNRNRSISHIIVGLAVFPYAFLSASFFIGIASFIALSIGISFLDSAKLKRNRKIAISSQIP